MLKIFSSTAFKSILPILLHHFESAYGVTHTIDFGTSHQILERLHQGEKADLLILTHDAINDLIQAGYCQPDSLKDLCQTSIGVAIAADASSLPIGTTTEFIDTLKKIQSITFTSKGASGIYFKKLLERLAISDEILPKSIILEGGLVAELILQNKAEMAIQLISEIKAVPSVKLLGPLPEELNQTTIFTAGIGIHSLERMNIEKLYQFLQTSQNQQLLQTKGLNPLSTQ